MRSRRIGMSRMWRIRRAMVWEGGSGDEEDVEDEERRVCNLVATG